MHPAVGHALARMQAMAAGNCSMLWPRHSTEHWLPPAQKDRSSAHPRPSQSQYDKMARQQTEKPSLFLVPMRDQLTLAPSHPSVGLSSALLDMSKVHIMEEIKHNPCSH